MKGSFSRNGDRPFPGDVYDEYLRDINELSPEWRVRKEQVPRLEFLASLGDTRARVLLIHHCLRLVIHIAKRKVIEGWHAGLDINDLIQAGNEGLIQAAVTFKFQGAKFSTWASYRIEGAIRDTIRNVWAGRGQPRRVGYLGPKIIDIALTLMETLGRDPTNEEIAQHLGISEEEVEEITYISTIVSQTPLPLESSGPLGGKQWEELIKDIQADNPELITVRRAQQKDIRSVINEVLLPRERLIIALRFNLTDDRRFWSFKQIGDSLGVSESRACQLCTRALLKLRSHPKIRELFEKLPLGQKSPA